MIPERITIGHESSRPEGLIATAVGFLRSAVEVLERAGSVEIAAKVRQDLESAELEFMRRWESVLRAEGRYDPTTLHTQRFAGRLYLGDY